MDDAALEYVVKGALMMCDKGAVPDKFKPTHNTTFKIDNKLLVGTNEDTERIENIPSFLICEVTGALCVPETEPLSWIDTAPITTDNGIDVLWAQSTCPCKVGGTIEFYTSGQIPLDDETEELLKEMQDEAKEALNDAGYGDTVGEPGFWESLIPFWGSGRSLINNAQQGRWGWAAVDGVFLFLDFGGGFIIKGLAKKIGGGVVRKILPETLLKFGENALAAGRKYARLSKGALGETLEKVAKATGRVTSEGCFVEGTLIHTENGLRNIEDIRIGDMVWAFHEENGDISLKKVLNTMVRQSDHTIKIHTEHEIIETTAEHPFYTNGFWTQVSNLQLQDKLITIQRYEISIKAIVYNCVPRNVYNFEVEDSHCYFVGEVGVLVHNSCPEALKKILPSWKKITMNLDHIVSNHTKDGLGYIQRMKSGTVRNIGKFPDYMNKDQVKKMVLEAYQNPIKKVKTVVQDGVEKIVLQGKAKDGTIIEMWLDKAGKHLETAYPK